MDGTLIHRDNVTTGETTDYLRLGQSGPTLVRLKTQAGVVTPTYTHNDHLGSASMGTSAGGSILWFESYTPFGEPLQTPLANEDNQGHTGHIQDTATGLTYMQARYYDPVIGRFLSNDPVGFADRGWQYFNRYSYTFNDPVNMVDPDGRQVRGTVVLRAALKTLGDAVGRAFVADANRKAEQYGGPAPGESILNDMGWDAPQGDTMFSVQETAAIGTNLTAGTLGVLAPGGAVSGNLANQAGGVISRAGSATARAASSGTGNGAASSALGALNDYAAGTRANSVASTVNGAPQIALKNPRREAIMETAAEVLDVTQETMEMRKELLDAAGG